MIEQQQIETIGRPQRPQQAFQDLVAAFQASPLHRERRIEEDDQSLRRSARSRFHSRSALQPCRIRAVPQPRKNQGHRHRGRAQFPSARAGRSPDSESGHAACRLLRIEVVGGNEVLGKIHVVAFEVPFHKVRRISVQDVRKRFALPKS